MHLKWKWNTSEIYDRLSTVEMFWTKRDLKWFVILSVSYHIPQETEIAWMLGSCQQTHSSNDIPVFLTSIFLTHLSHAVRRLRFIVLSRVNVLTWTLGLLCKRLFNLPRWHCQRVTERTPLTPVTPHSLLCVLKQLLFTFNSTQR